MRVTELIEKLEDLATFFTLAASDAGESVKAAKKKGNQISISYQEGRKIVFKIAFNKVDAIIKEAKR